MLSEAVARRHPWLARQQGRVTRKALLVPLIVVVSLVLLMVIIRLILDPIATYQTRQALNQMEGFEGDFERVHVTIFGPGYDIRKVKLTETHGDAAPSPNKPPLFYAERAHAGLSWRDLLHGKLVASLRLEDPKITIVQPPTPAPKTAKKAPPDLSAQLEKVAGLQVNRIEVFGGELLFRADGGPHPQEIWVHKLELTAQNLATREKFAGGRAATLGGHGVLGRSGDLNFFVSADPFASPLSFAGQMSVTGFRATELYAFLEPKAHLKAENGTIDVFAEFVAKKGLLTGGVKPVLKNIEVGPTEGGLGNRLKAWLVDKSVEVASDRVAGRNAVATTIPLKGDLTAPDIQLWPAVLGVIRNAFVQGLSSGFTNVPPKTADEKEGVLTQAKNALKKDEGPPKAQPVKQ